MKTNNTIVCFFKFLLCSLHYKNYFIIGVIGSTCEDKFSTCTTTLARYCQSENSDAETLETVWKACPKTCEKCGKFKDKIKVFWTLLNIYDCFQKNE